MARTTLLLFAAASAFAAGFALSAQAQPLQAQQMPAASVQLASAAAPKAVAMRYVSERDVARRLVSLVQQRNGGRPVEISFHGNDNGFSVPSTAEWRVDGFTFDDRSGRFTGTLAATGAPETVRISGRASPVEAMPVLKSRVAPGETIGADAVEWRQVPAGRYTSAYIDRIDDLIGQTPKRTLNIGQPIRSADIGRVEQVSKNALITMVAQVPGLTITTTGRALEGGAIGDVVQVMNLQSKKVIQATITGSNQVQVTTAPRLLASN